MDYIINICVFLFFIRLGFKATQAFDKCTSVRNGELVKLFNTSDIDPPPAGSPITLTFYDPSLKRYVNSPGIMPNLTTCDLKMEIQKVIYLYLLLMQDYDLCNC